MASNPIYLRENFIFIMREIKNLLGTLLGDHKDFFILEMEKWESEAPGERSIFERFFQKNELGFEIGHANPNQEFIEKYFSLKDYENLLPICRDNDRNLLQANELNDLIKKKYFEGVEYGEKLLFEECIEFHFFETWFNKIIGSYNLFPQNLF